MQLRDDIRQTLAVEFTFAANQMNKAADILELVYFYSAFYGAVNRALNLEWDSELALLHAVLLHSHQEIDQLANGLSRGQRFYGTPDNLPEELTRACRELANRFTANALDMEKIYPILARLAELSYSTTGNGRYNFARGNLKL